MVDIPDIASLDETFVVYGTYSHHSGTSRYDWSLQITWREIFGIIAPYILNYPAEHFVEITLRNELAERYNKKVSNVRWNNQIFQTIKIQLCALKLVNVKYSQTTQGGLALFWSLSQYGESLMYQIRTIRTKGAS